MFCVACSKDESFTSSVELPHFHDMSTASDNIQKAGNAVVRIHTALKYGTGSFISATGLLLTNNHVLGVDTCPTEGCYFEIRSFYQRGHAQVDPTTVFGVPQAVNIGLDMAVVQLYDQPGGMRVNSSDYLQFNPTEARALVGTHVTIVGHPKGNLKKWTDGVVVDTDGDWFTSTTYTVPGDSGSPVLDDSGQIVGLLHRGSQDEDLFTDTGVNLYSVGSASGPVSAAMNDPLPSVMLSVSASMTADEFIVNNLAYLNARAATVSIDGTATSALLQMGTACDQALARTDFVSPDDLSSALTPCYYASAWLECRADASAVAYGVSCPDMNERTNWITRFQSVDGLWKNMNGTLDYDALSTFRAKLETSRASGVTAGAALLSQALAASNPPLDFTLAYYLAAFDIASYAGTNVVDYVSNYSRTAHYELSAEYIAYAATWLYGSRALSAESMLKLVKRLLDDPKTSVGAQLEIESLLYELGAL